MLQDNNVKTEPDSTQMLLFAEMDDSPEQASPIAAIHAESHLGSSNPENKDSSNKQSPFRKSGMLSSFSEGPIGIDIG